MTCDPDWLVDRPMREGAAVLRDKECGLSGKCHAELKVRQDRVIIIQQAPFSSPPLPPFPSQTLPHYAAPCLPSLSRHTINSTSFSKFLPTATYKCTHPPHSPCKYEYCTACTRTHTHKHTQTHTHTHTLTSWVPEWLSLRLSSRAFCNRDSSPWRQRCSCRGGIVTSSTLTRRQWA